MSPVDETPQHRCAALYLFFFFFLNHFNPSCCLTIRRHEKTETFICLNLLDLHKRAFSNANDMQVNKKINATSSRFSFQILNPNSRHLTESLGERLGSD